MASLSLRGITKRYAEGAAALDGVDLDVEDGEFLALVGPSGCGKSTLLRVVAGLIEPTAGTVVLDGRDVTNEEPGGRDVAMVFQNYALYPHMTVRQNLAFPLRLRRMPRKDVHRRVGEVAERLGLAALLGRRPGKLSGGQMQRVALGRALVREPKVFLFDEPLSNLDAQLRTEMRGELRRLHRELGTTSVYVTHDQAEALTMGQRVCVLDAGRIQQLGPPIEVHDRPATRFVAEFIGTPAINILPAKIAGGRAHALGLELPAPAGSREGERLELGLRPHELVPAVDGELELRAVDVERLGSGTLVFGRAADGTVVRVLLPGDVPVMPGDPVAVSLGKATTHWFGSGDGKRTALPPQPPH